MPYLHTRMVRTVRVWYEIHVRYTTEPFLQYARYNKKLKKPTLKINHSGCPP